MNFVAAVMWDVARLCLPVKPAAPVEALCAKTATWEEHVRGAPVSMAHSALLSASRAETVVTAANST